MPESRLSLKDYVSGFSRPFWAANISELFERIAYYGMAPVLVPYLVQVRQFDESSAIRVGGLAARVQDERVALGLGLLGQETTGPGGIAYALRTIPVARSIAERVRAVAPQAWFINFTNPAGMVTEAMRDVLGDRVVGICDTPITMARRAAGLLGVDPRTRVELDYVGLNHLGWLRSLEQGGRDLLPGLLADHDALTGFEEGRLFGAAWLRALGSIPNEYLH